MHHQTRRWTEDEIELLKRRKAEGIKADVIASELGRTKSSVNERWRWMINNEEIKARRRRRSANIIVRDAPNNVPNDVLIERERRLTAPLTINCLILGDPRPGFSALDRRAAQ